MQTTCVKPQRKRKRDSIHHSLRWYCILALTAIDSHSHSANALSRPNSRTKYAFSSSDLANLRGGNKASENDDDVMAMDDSELDAYIDFLLTESNENPFQTPEDVAAAETEQEEPTPNDDSLVPDDPQQEEEEPDLVQPIQSEEVPDEIDISVSDAKEMEAVVEEETSGVVSSSEEENDTVQPIHSEHLQDEMDTSATDSMETEVVVEEAYNLVASSEEAEMSDPSISESDERDAEGTSSEIVQDDEAIPQSEEENLIADASAEDKSTDIIDESSETEKTQKIASRRSSIWGRLFKQVDTFEQDDSPEAESEENIDEEVAEGEAEAEEDAATTNVQEIEVVPVSSEDNAESRPSLKERYNDQWQKVKSMMGTKSKIAAKEADDESTGRESQRDYSKIYQKYYAAESSTEATDSSETKAPSKSGSRRLAFFSKKSTSEEVPERSSTPLPKPIVDMEPSALESDGKSCATEEPTTIRRHVLSLDRIQDDADDNNDVSKTSSTASSESIEEVSCVVQEPATIGRHVLSLDRIEEVSHDNEDNFTSDQTAAEQLEESLEIDSNSQGNAPRTTTIESSEKKQDPVVLSLDIPETEKIDEKPTLEAEEEEIATQESMVLSLDVPVEENMKENEDEPPIEEDQVESDSRILLSLDIPKVDELDGDEEVVCDNDRGETSHNTDALSVDVPVVNTSEDVEVDLAVESEDDSTSSIVGRFVLSLDRPQNTVELDEEGLDGETLEVEDDSDVENEIISSDSDRATEIDFETSKEDQRNFDDATAFDVESLSCLELDDSDEEVSNETIDDVEGHNNEMLEEQDSIVTPDDSKVSKSKKKEKLSIVDRSLLALLLVTMLVEELLKAYILPVVEELLDWGMGKPPPLFREDFSIRKFLGLRGGAAKTTTLGSTKAKLEDKIGDKEESEEGSDSDAENRSTTATENEAPGSSAQQMSIPRVRPNFFYRYLLGFGLPGHSIIMISIFSLEWIQTYLPTLAFFAASVRLQVLGDRPGFRDSEESFAAQTTGFVDGTGSTVRGAKKKKAQTQKDDQQALDQLKRLGDANQARYYFVSNAFLKRHAIGPYSGSSSQAAVDVKVADVDEYDEESEEDWVVDALTRKGESGPEPSADVSISSSGSALSVGIDFGFGEKSKKSTKRASISEVAISSASSRSTKSRKPRVQRVSDRESGVVGRIRAVGANSLVGRSILGAYPGDVPSPDEAADPDGLLGLASKYGYGDWSDVDWSDQGDSEFASSRRKSRKKRRSAPGSMRKEKETLGGLDLEEIVRDTQSSRTRRSVSASSQPRTKVETASSATETVKKTRIRRKKKLPSTSILERTNAQKDSAKSAAGSKILKTENPTTSGGTVTGPAIESMKKSAKSEESAKPHTATASSASSKVIEKPCSGTATQSSSVLKKTNAQKRIIKSASESKVLNPESASTTASAVAGSAMESLKKAARSKADATDASSPATKASPSKTVTSSSSSSVLGPAIGSIKESAAKAKSGVVNSAFEDLKKKAKAKSKSSILDAKEEKANSSVPDQKEEQ